MSTRNYSSPLREAEAAATRARIVDAAGELFVRDGFVATSMKAIAAAAGVSVQTVNLQGPKHALLIAAFERAFAGDEGRQPLAERPAMQAIIAEPDTGLAVRAYAAFLADANARAAGLIRAMALAADADEGARAAYADLEDRRRRDMLIAAGFFVQRGLLAPERTQWAADQLGVITGPDAYLHLVGSCGWTRDAYEEWVVRSLEQLYA
ncbi:TetR/AcrR family transcriptional regulator [Schumannella luteola]